jgi:hypothetical protein
MKSIASFCHPQLTSWVQTKPIINTDFTFVGVENGIAKYLFKMKL